MLALRLKLAVSLTAASAASACTPDPVVVWEEAFDASAFGAQLGIWSSAPDDVFMVGGSETQASIHHWDGDRWTSMDVPEVPALVWVHGFGSDDVFAVGLAGTVLHYDGAEWTQIEIGTQVDLWGVFGFTPDDLWIVGGDPFGDFPLLAHYDGEDFEGIDIPETENVRDARALFKVWGVDGTVFAVGQNGQVLEYAGDTWRNSPAGDEADDDFVSLSGTRLDDIVLVGGRSDARIATYDGDAWTTRKPSATGGLSGVHVVESGRAAISGVEGFVGWYDLANREVAREEQSVTDLDIHAVWQDGAGKTYAAAGDFLPPFQGAALVRSER